MVCSFSRAMLGASVLLIAAGCASAPSQQRPAAGDTNNSSMRVDELQARSSGVNIQSTGGGALRVTLMAAGSFGATTYTPTSGTDASRQGAPPPQNVTLGSNQPLYLLDGVPFTPGPGGLLIGINPHDIASIKALKDPTDLSLYGMRGANGVISITTKKLGAQNDTTRRPND